MAAVIRNRTTDVLPDVLLNVLRHAAELAVSGQLGFANGHGVAKIAAAVLRRQNLRFVQRAGIIRRIRSAYVEVHRLQLAQRHLLRRIAHPVEGFDACAKGIADLPAHRAHIRHRIIVAIGFHVKLADIIGHIVHHRTDRLRVKVHRIGAIEHIVQIKPRLGEGFAQIGRCFHDHLRIEIVPDGFQRGLI